MNKKNTLMRVALCYDQLTTFGGAERLFYELAELYPQADIFALTIYQDHLDRLHGRTIQVSWLNKIPFLRTRYKFFPLFAQLIWERFNFRHYDLVITITTSSAKSIMVAPETLHVCYCLTPTRYLWSHYHSYLEFRHHGLISSVVNLIHRVLATNYRMRDFYSAQRPDQFIAISAEVARRIQHYYRREAPIVYPPVSYLNETKSADLQVDTSYFLVVSRLVPISGLISLLKRFLNLVGLWWW